MSGIFNLDAPIWVFMSEVADVIILAILWWVCCLGIVTIGASTTAMYYVLGKKIRKEPTYVAKDFFKSFGQNFRQAVPLSFITIIGFISFFLYVLLIIESIFVPEETSDLKFLIPVTLLFAFEFFNFNTYMWALLSRFEMKSKALVKTAFIMVHRHFITTLANLVVVAAVAFLVYKCPLVLILAPVLIMGGQSFFLQNIFTHYIEAEKQTEEKKKDQAQQNEAKLEQTKVSKTEDMVQQVH